MKYVFPQVDWMLSCLAECWAHDQYVVCIRPNWHGTINTRIVKVIFFYIIQIQTFKAYFNNPCWYSIKMRIVKVNRRQRIPLGLKAFLKQLRSQ